MPEQLQQSSKESSAPRVDTIPIEPTDWQQEILNRDLRLQKLSKDPTEMRGILDALSQNQSLLSRTDNLAEQSRLWNESLKGYGQMTQDGREFAKLTEKEVDGLMDDDYDSYNKWKITQKAATIVSKRDEGKQLDTTINQKGGGTEGVERIESARKNLEKINSEAKDVLGKLELTDRDKTTVSSLLSEAKSGKSDNAAVLELKRQGVADADIQSGRYDSYISASILIENAGKLEASRNPSFQKSIRDLQSLGIPVRVQGEFLTISKHLEERFAPGDRTEQGTRSIRQSLSKEGYTGVYYDGRGERYTLTSPDGTRKDIIMNKPPEERISLSGLSVKREIPAATHEDKKREQIKQKYQLHSSKQAEIIGNLALVESEKPEISDKTRVLYTRALSGATSLPDRLEAIGELKKINTSRKEQGLQDLLETGNTEKIAASQTKLEKELYGLDMLERYYTTEGAIIKEAQSVPLPESDTFDQTARENLSWITNTKLYHRFPRAQDLLEGVIDGINMSRDEKNKIRLGERALDPADRNTIDQAYGKVFAYLGVDPTILRTAEIGTVGEKINTLLRDNSKELRNILSETEPKPSGRS